MMHLTDYEVLVQHSNKSVLTQPDEGKPEGTMREQTLE